MLRCSHEHDALCEAHAAGIGLQAELKVDTLQVSGFDVACAECAKHQDPVPTDLWGQTQLAPQPDTVHRACKWK